MDYFHILLFLLSITTIETFRKITNGNLVSQMILATYVKNRFLRYMSTNLTKTSRLYFQ